MSGLNQTEIASLEKFLSLKDKVAKQLEGGLDPVAKDILERNALDLWLSQHLWFWKANHVEDGKGGEKR